MDKWSKVNVTILATIQAKALSVDITWTLPRVDSRYDEVAKKELVYFVAWAWRSQREISS